MRGLVCGRPVSRHDVTSDDVCEHKATRTRPPIGATGDGHTWPVPRYGHERQLGVPVDPKTSKSQTPWHRPSRGCSHGALLPL